MKEETARLSQVRKTAIGALGFSLRQVERRLGLSRGYLTRLFAGEMDLKIDRVVEIAGVLGVEPEEIFRLAFPNVPRELTPQAAILRQALGAKDQPPTPSGLESEIEKFVLRVLARKFPQPNE